MIIILNGDEINLKTAELLRSQSGSSMESVALYPDVINSIDTNNETLKIISLNINKGNLNLPSGILFANQLKKSGLLETVRTIELLIPEVNSKVINFASSIVDNLYKEFKLQIPINIISNINYACTVLFPPFITNGKWEIYGYKMGMINLSEFDALEQLYKFENKQLLFSNNDLQLWFSNPQRIVMVDDVRMKSLDIEQQSGSEKLKIRF